MKKTNPTNKRKIFFYWESYASGRLIQYM